jgi:pimeloyl-ACP methyl ester carboxylesterase
LAVPQGDGSAVVVIPGFLGTDAFMAELYAWLHRMNYRPYFSGIGLNADCPHLLVKRQLDAVVDRAVRETGRKIHLIGHSLGGLKALALAAQRPDAVASVITLAAPIRGNAAHPNVLAVAEWVRQGILAKYGDQVLPHCFTAQCSCDFVNTLKYEFRAPVKRTAVYTKTDSVVDWRYCRTGDPNIDVEAPGTHIGLIFNPSVYKIMADRLAAAHDATPVLTAKPRVVEIRPVPAAACHVNGHAATAGQAAGLIQVGCV